jgi:hypothetical protein
MLRALCLASALILLATAGWAQNNPSPSNNNSAEARACHGDARRFCREVLGDEFSVASCLIEHRDRLTRACRAMLESHGM